MIDKKRIINTYYSILVLLGGSFIFIHIPNWLGKKLLSIYFIIGVIISFKFKMVIFGRQKEAWNESKDSDKNSIFAYNSFDKDCIFANILVVFLSLYLLIFDWS